MNYLSQIAILVIVAACIGPCMGATCACTAGALTCPPTVVVDRCSECQDECAMFGCVSGVCEVSETFGVCGCQSCAEVSPDNEITFEKEFGFFTACDALAPGLGGSLLCDSVCLENACTTYSCDVTATSVPAQPTLVAVQPETVCSCPEGHYVAVTPELPSGVVGIPDVPANVTLPQQICQCSECAIGAPSFSVPLQCLNDTQLCDLVCFEATCSISQCVEPLPEPSAVAQSDLPFPSGSTAVGAPCECPTTAVPNPTTPGPEMTTPGPEMTTPGPEMTTPGPEMTTPGPEMTTPGPEMTTPGPEMTTPGPEMTTPGPEMTTPGPEMTTPGPEMTTPGPAMTTPGPEMTTPGPEMTTPGPEMTTPGPEMTTPGPEMTTPGPEMTTPGPEMTTPGPEMTTPGPEMTTPGPEMTTPGPEMTTPGPAMTTPGPEMTTPGPAMTTPGPALIISVPTPVLDLSSPTPSPTDTPATGNASFDSSGVLFDPSYSGCRGGIFVLLAGGVLGAQLTPLISPSFVWVLADFMQMVTVAGMTDHSCTTNGCRYFGNLTACLSWTILSDAPLPFSDRSTLIGFEEYASSAGLRDTSGLSRRGTLDYQGSILRDATANALEVSQAWFPPIAVVYLIGAAVSLIFGVLCYLWTTCRRSSVRRTKENQVKFTEEHWTHGRSNNHSRPWWTLPLAFLFRWTQFSFLGIALGASYVFAHAADFDSTPSDSYGWSIASQVVAAIFLAVVVIAFLVLIFRMMHSWNRGVTDPSVSVAKHRDQLRRQAYMGVIISSATWMYTWSARYFLLSVLFRRLFVALLYGMGTSPRLQVLGVLIVLFLHIGLLKFFRPYRLHQRVWYTLEGISTAGLILLYTLLAVIVFGTSTLSSSVTHAVGVAMVFVVYVTMALLLLVCIVRVLHAMHHRCCGPKKEITEMPRNLQAVVIEHDSSTPWWRTNTNTHVAETQGTNRLWAGDEDIPLSFEGEARFTTGEMEPHNDEAREPLRLSAADLLVMNDRDLWRKLDPNALSPMVRTRSGLSDGQSAFLERRPESVESHSGSHLLDIPVPILKRNHSYELSVTALNPSATGDRPSSIQREPSRIRSFVGPHYSPRDTTDTDLPDRNAMLPPFLLDFS